MRSTLWTYSLTSGLAHRLGNISAHAAAWSSDGASIAYVVTKCPAKGSDLYVTDRYGNNTRKIARIEEGFPYPLRWSPDARVLRMNVAGRIWEVSADGSNLHHVALFRDDERTIGSINWTPDGRYFVFVALDPEQSRTDLWAIREKKTLSRRGAPHPVQLTAGMSYRSPVPSADGRQIFAIGGKFVGELLRYDEKSGRLEPFLNGISAEQVDFSRDGQWVAYITFPEEELWRSRPDGTERMQLTMHPLYAALPRWSPDGTRIVFVSGQFGQFSKIYTVPAQGGPAELVYQQQGPVSDPMWSPDGNSLVFGESTTSEHPQIWTLDLRTRQVSPVVGSEDLYSPRLSPDGKFIAAMDMGQSKLLLFDRQRQRWSPLFVLGRGGFGWPQWSGDSQFVYIRDAFDVHVPILYRIRIADRKTETVAKINVPTGLIGMFNGWMGTAPDGTPLLLRDIQVTEIYALDVSLP